MRHAKRTDRNHGEIRDGLRADGYLVDDLSDVGQGVPDLAVQSPRGWPPALFVEIKDGKKPPSARKLTEAEVRFMSLIGPDRYKVANSLLEAREICLAYFHPAHAAVAQQSSVKSPNQSSDPYGY
jgi:hypothetical protein